MQNLIKPHNQHFGKLIIELIDNLSIDANLQYLPLRVFILIVNLLQSLYASVLLSIKRKFLRMYDDAIFHMAVNVNFHRSVSFKSPDIFSFRKSCLTFETIIHPCEVGSIFFCLTLLDENIYCEKTSVKFFPFLTRTD